MLYDFMFLCRQNLLLSRLFNAYLMSRISMFFYIKTDNWDLSNKYGTLSLPLFFLTTTFQFILVIQESNNFVPWIDDNLAVILGGINFGFLVMQIGGLVLVASGTVWLVQPIFIQCSWCEMPFLKRGGPVK